MLELLLCSSVTILPDYLFRRFVQGKRIGEEITLFSVWYELRWGITACVIMTLALITIIFYFHPITTNVSSLFRTVTILSEAGGRVEEVYVGNNQQVKAGDRLFRLEDSSQRAAVDTARKRIAEIDANLVLAQSELAAADGLVRQAEGANQQAVNELQRRRTLQQRNASVVALQEIETLENRAESQKGNLMAAMANREVVKAKIGTQLPAQRASAQAALRQAETELAKTVVHAGVTGTVQQFILKPGDIVNPILRPAGILVPTKSGRGRFQAGFGQIAAQIIHAGMIAEIACMSKPFTIIPMVVVGVQDVIPAGQFRPGDQLIDPQDRARPGTLLAIMEPIYAGHGDGIPPGSKCVAVAYTNHADLIASGELDFWQSLSFRVIDGLGLANALILRIHALMLPVRALVFSG